MVSDVGYGGSYACIGIREIWNISVFFSQLSCRTKTSLKIIFKNYEKLVAPHSRSKWKKAYSIEIKK